MAPWDDWNTWDPGPTRYNLDTYGGILRFTKIKDRWVIFPSLRFEWEETLENGETYPVTSIGGGKFTPKKAYDHAFNVSRNRKTKSFLVRIPNGALQKLVHKALGKTHGKLTTIQTSHFNINSQVLELTLYELLQGYQKLKGYLVWLHRRSYNDILRDDGHYMAYDLLKLFVFDFLCNEDIFASDDLQLLRHLGILSTEHWQDMKTYMTLSALGFRWMGEWRHILMRPVPEPVINCPVARDIRQSHRMNIQRHFREQRDRLMKPSKVTKEELRCLTSSTSEQWKIGIRETQHMLHGQSTPNTLEGIISCLMVAESMRLFGEEKETTPVSRDQIFDDFRVWRRLVPEEDRPLFDRISHAVWGISGLESADPCSISSGDCERVLPYLNKLVSSLVSSTADFILDEEDDVSGTEDGYTLRQIRRWFAKEPPSTEQLDYRRTRLKQELSPPPIEEIKLPDRVEKYKPARPEVVLIISTAIFAVIFAFLYLLQAVDTEEIEYFNACLSGLTGLEAHAIVLSIYLGVLSPAHMKPSSEPKSAKNTTCGKCGKVFSSTSNLGKHWRALCGSSGEMFSCRLQSEGCTYTCNRRDNMRLHEKTCSFRSMEIQDYEFEFGWQLEGFAEHMA